MESAGAANRPPSSVSRCRRSPVSTLTTVTAARAIAFPSGSETRPQISAVPVCAYTIVWLSNKRTQNNAVATVVIEGVARGPQRFVCAASSIGARPHPQRGYDPHADAHVTRGLRSRHLDRHLGRCAIGYQHGARWRNVE